MFFGNASVPPVNITPNFISNTRMFGSFITINDSDMVVGEDLYSGNETYYIRS